MVDPNRKINRLTDKDIEFLDECEEEFANRYTEADEDFLQHCSKTLVEPPIVDNWNFSGGSHQNNRGYYGAGRNGGGGGNNRGWRGSRNSNYRARHNPFENRRDRTNGRDNETSNRAPMTIRKDYSNFVAASKN